MQEFATDVSITDGIFVPLQIRRQLQNTHGSSLVCQIVDVTIAFSAAKSKHLLRCQHKSFLTHSTKREVLLNPKVLKCGWVGVKSPKRWVKFHIYMFILHFGSFLHLIFQYILREKSGRFSQKS